MRNRRAEAKGWATVVGDERIIREESQASGIEKGNQGKNNMCKGQAANRTTNVMQASKDVSEKFMQRWKSSYNAIIQHCV